VADALERPLLSLGEILIDLIAAPPATGLQNVARFDVRPGGAPANVAVALARLGCPAAFCGVVGNDPFGERLRATLQADQVDTSRLRMVEETETSLAMAWKDAHGDGHFRFVRLADRLLSIDDVSNAGIADTAGIVVGSVALSVEPSRGAIMRAVDIAAASGIPICFDVNARPALWASRKDAIGLCASIARRATLLKLSVDDARFLFGSATAVEAFASARTWTDKTVVVTDGARGAWFLPSGTDDPLHVEPYDVQAVEPTGAGDAFTAALIVRLIERGWQSPDHEDIQFAAAAGALATTRPGALDGLPTQAEIEAFRANAKVQSRAITR
jgi:fructokinase